MSRDFDINKLSPDMRSALIAYAQANGRNWKNKLREDRMSSNPQVTGTLRAFMNAYGEHLRHIRIP